MARGFAHHSAALSLKHAIVEMDITDGLRFALASVDIVHLRPSGNAPEMRCYAESSSAAGAEVLVAHCLGGLCED
ncbi:hypothetical protein [Modicisalibacter sp. 'Wilcox']|uniref:hypothetical protein n=1 Tax=Modicisalibacter sp. 'Wilcox' TaxID=2679914 RepID=UPI003204DA34